MCSTTDGGTVTEWIEDLLKISMFNQWLLSNNYYRQFYITSSKKKKGSESRNDQKQPQHFWWFLVPQKWLRVVLELPRAPLCHFW